MLAILLRERRQNISRRSRISWQPRERWGLLCINLKVMWWQWDRSLLRGRFMSSRSTLPGSLPATLSAVSVLHLHRKRHACKHISLLQLEVPHLTFLKVDREDIHRDLDLLALAPQVEHGQWDLQQPEPHPELGLSYYLDRINSLEALRDKNKTIPHESALCALLGRFLDIYEPSFSCREGEDLSNKRQRQCY